MENKADLRLKAKNIRKSLNIDEVSHLIVDLVRKHPYYIAAKKVMIFYPTKYEINLLNLLEDKKEFYLPKVDGQNLLVCPYCCDDKLEKSSFNILEPCSNPVKAENLDLVIVPALMADEKGFRLGYGGGFYDRFLSLYEGDFKTIVVVPKVLYVRELPVDEYDKSVDGVIFA